jgi:hypothetical protein
LEFLFSNDEEFCLGKYFICSLQTSSFLQELAPLLTSCDPRDCFLVDSVCMQHYISNKPHSRVSPLTFLLTLLKMSSLLPDDGKPDKFTLKFLGSVEVGYHKGNDVLCQAISKVSVGTSSAGILANLFKPKLSQVAYTL